MGNSAVSCFVHQLKLYGFQVISRVSFPSPFTCHSSYLSTSFLCHASIQISPPNQYQTWEFCHPSSYVAALICSFRSKKKVLHWNTAMMDEVQLSGDIRLDAIQNKIMRVCEQFRVRPALISFLSSILLKLSINICQIRYFSSTNMAGISVDDTIAKISLIHERNWSDDVVILIMDCLCLPFIRSNLYAQGLFPLKIIWFLIIPLVSGVIFLEHKTRIVSQILCIIVWSLIKPIPAVASND